VHVGKRSNRKTGLRCRCGALLELVGKSVIGATINLLGLTFRENVSDLRNSKVAELRADALRRGGCACWRL